MIHRWGNETGKLFAELRGNSAWKAVDSVTCSFVKKRRGIGESALGADRFVSPCAR